MKILVTGSSGLVGSALVDRFCGAGHEVVGFDNDARRWYFGFAGSTEAIGVALLRRGLAFKLHSTDCTDQFRVARVVKESEPDAVVHCAAQPSHDWAAEHPLEDFHVNAMGTLNVLEACRRHCPEAPFVFMSTNKVYGALYDWAFVEHETRINFAPDLDYPGIDEKCRVDHTMHALYGAGKLAADIYVQEYGRYYGMRTVCLRAGCITGAGHAAVAAHGFLSYLVKCNVRGDRYVVTGYGGKQVRDNLHAADLARLIEMIVQEPPAPGTVYNVGGGKAEQLLDPRGVRGGGGDHGQAHAL